MHYHDISRLDAQTRFAFPFLEVGRGINIVIPNAQGLKVDHHAWPNQFVQGNTANILPIGNKVPGGIKMRAYMEGGRDILSPHFIKGDTLDPLDGRAFIGGKSRCIHIPVLRQVDYAHRTQVNWLHPFSSLLFPFLYRLKDDLVDQLFDRGTVISKIDVRGFLLADMPVSNASISNTFKQRIRQFSGVSKKIVKRCPRIGANDQATIKTRYVYDIDIGKGSTHRLCQGFYEAEITARTPGVHHRHTSRRKMGSYLAKEFNRAELERYIRLLIAIDST